MNEQQKMIRDALQRILKDFCSTETVEAAELGEWPVNLWRALSESGLTLAGISEQAGGTGGEVSDSLLVISEAAHFAAPVPLAEHFLAALLLEGSGLTVSKTVMTVAIGEFEFSPINRLTGKADHVSFGRWADEIVLLAVRDEQHFVCRVNRSDIDIALGANLAGEPMDAITIDLNLDEGCFSEVPKNSGKRLLLMGAALRGLMMAGALESILEMSVQYSMDRAQFGRPISKFQAIQHQIAVLAGETAASTMAAHTIVSAFEEVVETDIAIGKARIGEAVSVCTDIAHQVHGAMGYTMEHSLNHRTRRLWAWRDEYGAERYWQLQVGRKLMETGADNLWSSISGLG